MNRYTKDEFFSEGDWNSISTRIEQNRFSSGDEILEKFYSARVQQYEANMHLTFEIQGCVERTERLRAINRLGDLKGKALLEIGCGTGRDSEIILDSVSNRDTAFDYCISDISFPMLEFCQHKLRGRISDRQGGRVRLCQASACELPFEDESFDTVYSFGILSDLPDIPLALSEINRVVKSGGKVVIVDEGVAPHLRDTAFYKYISFTNPAFSSSIPLASLHQSSRDVNLSWLNNNTFYLIEYSVEKSEISCDIDRKIPGLRGGTLRSRVDGQLEGISITLKKAFCERASECEVGQAELLEQIIEEWLDGSS